MFSKEQELIVAHRAGHAMVLAGPGTGKTTTMVGRISALLESGEDPKNILILMFNKSARLDFSAKLQQTLPDSQSPPEVRTYHSLALATLEALERKGVIEKMTLEPSEKAREMIALEVVRRTLGNQKLNKLQKDQDKVIEEFLSFVDLVKAYLLPPKEIFEAFFDNHELKFFIDCYESFEETRKTKKLRFFSDLLSDLALTIRNNEYVSNWIRNRKSHIIVDEYQDTNLCQHEILKAISGDTASVMVVGDVDQSIYDWRGGTPELMLNQFEKDYPDSVRYNLSKTFRFGSELSTSANKLIQNNSDRFDTQCESDPANPNTTINIISHKKPGFAVSRQVMEMKRNGYHLSDITILVRLYSAALPVELELIANGIPVAIDNGFSCFLSKEYKNIVHLLKLAGCHNDNIGTLTKEDTANLLKFPHIGLPGHMINEIAAAAENCPSDRLPSMLLGYSANLTIPFQRHKLNSRAKALKIVLDMGKSGASAHQILSVYQRETDLFGSLKKLALKETEGTETVDRCKSIFSFIESKGTALEAILWLDSLDKKRITLSQEAEKVTITSIHKAKGLEYKTVIMTGLEDGRFPYEKPGDSNNNSEIESERRLFYVGITRAIDHLFLDAPLSGDNLKIETAQVKIKKSRFLSEIT